MTKEFYSTSPELEKQYSEALKDLPEDKRSLEPSSFQEYLKLRPQHEVSHFVFKILRNMIDGQEVGQHINEMEWYIHQLKPDTPNLFSSDRPILITDGLDKYSSHMILAIGPRRFFLATNDIGQISVLDSKKERQIVLEYNRKIIQHAKRYVYGTDDQLLSYVRKHFGTVHQQRFVERLVSKRRDTSSN